MHWWPHLDEAPQKPEKQQAWPFLFAKAARHRGVVDTPSQSPTRWLELIKPASSSGALDGTGKDVRSSPASSKYRGY